MIQFIEASITVVIAKYLFLLAFLGENQNEGFGEILGLTI
jgi:hypothetical protein